jgi:hypothetical protein
LIDSRGWVIDSPDSLQLFACGASTAGNAAITTNSGGITLFLDTSTGGGARLIANAGGTIDISGLPSSGMTAGSIEGTGTYALGSKALTVGSNNSSTEVSGPSAAAGFAAARAAL